MTWRRALWLLAPVALFAAAVWRIAELSSLLAAFRGATLIWLLIAGVLAAAFAVNQGAIYRGVFSLLGVSVRLADAVWLSLVMAFASLALPAGTASGIAYFVMSARARGIGSSRALLAGLAYYLFDYGALIPVLLAGMVVLRAHHDVGAGPLLALGAFFVMALAAGALVVSGLVYPEQVAKIVAGFAGRIGALARMVGRRPPRDASTELAGELREILTMVRSRPKQSLRPLAHAVILQTLSVGMLGVVFAALGVRVSAAVLIAGYAVGAIFMVVSVTPAGVGVVETAMTFTFASLGISLEVAAAAAILYRLFTFWMPMLAGFVALRLQRPLVA